MSLDDFLEEIEVWPENQRAIDIFLEVGTQWRIGMSGATGLDYNMLYRRMDMLRLSDAAWDALFQDMRILEAAALQAMKKKA